MNDKEYLLYLHGICDDHLKEQSGKTWNVLSFYSVLLVAYFGTFLLTNGGGTVQPGVSMTFSLVMIVLGGLLVHYSIAIRSWHRQYLSDCQFLLHLLRKEQQCEKGLSKPLRDIVQEKKEGLKNLNESYREFTSSDILIYLLTFLASVPGFVLVYVAQERFSWWMLGAEWGTLSAIALSAVAGTAAQILVFSFLQKEKKRASEEFSWLIDLDDCKKVNRLLATTAENDG